MCADLGRPRSVLENVADGRYPRTFTFAVPLHFAQASDGLVCGLPQLYEGAIHALAPDLREARLKASSAIHLHADPLPIPAATADSSTVGAQEAGDE
jgi:hypothetical protein